MDSKTIIVGFLVGLLPWGILMYVSLRPSTKNIAVASVTRGRNTEEVLNEFQDSVQKMLVSSSVTRGKDTEKVLNEFQDSVQKMLVSYKRDIEKQIASMRSSPLSTNGDDKSTNHRPQMEIANTNSFVVPKTDWSTGIDFEIQHHSKWLCGKPCGMDIEKMGPWFVQEKADKLAARPIQIHQSQICDKLQKYARGPIKLALDHGAGPFTQLGSYFTCPATKISAKVISVDPLAPLYHSLLNKYDVYNTTRSMYCPSEKLSLCFAPDTFDFSIIVNALDHSEDPYAAWLQAAKVTRIGGLACVFTIENEAEHMGGKGFHQWNFFFGEAGDWNIQSTREKTLIINVDKKTESFMASLPISFNPNANPRQAWKCYRKIASVPAL